MSSAPARQKLLAHVGRTIERPARAAFVGALVAACITLPGLGAGTLWDNSETAYGEVAREVLLYHSWVVMHLNGIPWFVQPPLYFWIAALFIKLFGLTSFALRLPSALATICMGAMTGYAVSRQVGTRVGIYASVILSSCLMQAVIGRLAIMDALLDLSVALAIFWWFRSIEAGQDRYFVYGWIAAGFGFLAKGLVAPVVALMVMVPFVLWNARAEQIRLPSLRAWILGVLACVAISAPWLIAIGVHSGLGALVDLIVHYTIGRYTGVIENQAGPVWYYVPVMILGFFPWIAFLPMTIVYGIAQLRASSATDPSVARLWRLGITWIVVPFVFFSFARTKLPNYVALEFPALALVTALYFDAVVRRGVSRAAIVSAATVPIFIGMIAFALWAFSRDNRFAPDAYSLVPDLVSMGAAIFVGSALSAVLLARRATLGIAPYAIAAATLVAMDVLAVFALPKADRFKPVPQLAAVIERDRHVGDVVAIQSYRGANSLVFYTQPGVHILAPVGVAPSGDAAGPRSVVCTARRVWLVAPKQRPPYDPTYGRDRRIVAESGSAALFLIDGPRCTNPRGI
ncbi:MAG: glycosyltransferase family 39 protein [Vulcanimicrobiaceae bacterium]